MTGATAIRIEVVFAQADRQIVLPLAVPAGTTLYEAVLRSGIAGHFPPGTIDPAQAAMGVFGRLEKNPRTRVLEDGDRIEIYRPLTVDPNGARLVRAKKSKRGVKRD